MVSQNKRFSFKIKRQAKNIFPRDVERTVDMCPKYTDAPALWPLPIRLFPLAPPNSPTPAGSVAQLDAPSDWRPGGRWFNPRRGRQHSFMETDHKIFSTVILSLPLIQEGQLSVSGERMYTILVNRLED